MAETSKECSVTLPGVGCPAARWTHAGSNKVQYRRGLGRIFFQVEQLWIRSLNGLGVRPKRTMALLMPESDDILSLPDFWLLNEIPGR